jgi:hypothetical protein
MDSKQVFDYGMERAIQCWTEGLAPANGMERRLVRSIARQDFMMCISMKNAIELNDDKESAKHLRVQRDLGATLDSLIHALSTLQRQRLALEPPPPPATKAKVIPISKGARPKKVELEPEPVPNVQPFTSGQGRTKERGASPSLDFKIAA